MLLDNMTNKSGFTIQKDMEVNQEMLIPGKIYAESEKRKNVKTPVNQRRGRC